MSENFKVIETQEELDKIIKSRLAQKDREIAESYKDYLSPEKAEALKADYEKSWRRQTKISRMLRTSSRLLTALSQSSQKGQRLLRSLS